MKTSIDVILKEYDLELLEEDYDRISVFIDDAKKLNRICARLNKLTKGMIVRVISSKEFEKKSCGDILTLSFPGGLQAKYLDLVKWTKSGQPNDARKAGVNLAKKSGNSKILVTERGASFGYNTLVSDMRSLPIMAKNGYPVVFDATHSVQQPGGMGEKSGGQREFVEYLARAAIAVGVAAIFIETHPDPDNAPSDGPNMVPLSEMPSLLKQLCEIDKLIKNGKN